MDYYGNEASRVRNEMTNQLYKQSYEDSRMLNHMVDKLNNFRISQNEIIYKYIKRVELALESLHRDKDVPKAIHYYTDCIEIMTLYNKNHNIETHKDCNYTLDIICELHIKIVDCYCQNYEFATAYTYLNSSQLTKNDIIDKKIHEVKKMVQDPCDRYAILRYENKLMDEDDAEVYSEIYDSIIGVNGDETHCRKLMIKIDWFSKKDKYIFTAKKLLNSGENSGEGCLEDSEGCEGCGDEDFDCILMTEQLHSSVKVFENAFLYLTDDEKMILGELEAKIKKYSKELKLKLGQIQREQEIKNNVDAQSVVYQKFNGLKISIKNGDIVDANNILNDIINTAKTITNSKDIENAELVYTDPFMFIQYSAYLTVQIANYENDKKHDIEQQLIKINDKLKSLVHNKYCKNLKLCPRDMEYMLKWVSAPIKAYYKKIYKRTIPETMSSSVADIIFNGLTRLRFEDGLRRLSGHLSYDLRVHNSNIDDMQNTGTKISNTIIDCVNSLSLIEADLQVPSFLNTYHVINSVAVDSAAVDKVIDTAKVKVVESTSTKLHLKQQN